MSRRLVFATVSSETSGRSLSRRSTGIKSTAAPPPALHAYGHHAPAPAPPARGPDRRKDRSRRPEGPPAPTASVQCTRGIPGRIVAFPSRLDRAAGVPPSASANARLRGACALRRALPPLRGLAVLTEPLDTPAVADPRGGVDHRLVTFGARRGPSSSGSRSSAQRSSSGCRGRAKPYVSMRLRLRIAR
jgi:hypothetical protein